MYIYKYLLYIRTSIVLALAIQGLRDPLYFSRLSRICLFVPLVVFHLLTSDFLDKKCTMQSVLILVHQLQIYCRYQYSTCCDGHVILLLWGSKYLHPHAFCLLFCLPPGACSLLRLRQSWQRSSSIEEDLPRLLRHCVRWSHGVIPRRIEPRARSALYTSVGSSLLASPNFANINY